MSESERVCFHIKIAASESQIKFETNFDIILTLVTKTIR